MDGFVRELRRDALRQRRPGCGSRSRDWLLNAADVPVYDHLASEFGSAIAGSALFPGRPGPTVYTRFAVAPPGVAMTGRSTSRPCTTSPRSCDTSTRTTSRGAGTAFEAGTLRFADGHYKLGHHHSFAFFSKTNLNWRTSLELRIDAKAASFLEDAAKVRCRQSMDRPELQQLQPNRLSAQRRPPARGHQGRPGACARRLPRARNKPPMGKDAPHHLLRRARRLLRSRRAACGARRRPRHLRTLRRADTGAGRLALGGARVCIQDALRSHVDHARRFSCASARSPRRAKAASRAVCAAQKLRAPPPHGHARVAGQ